MQYTFSYGYHKSMVVTVRADNEEEACDAAREALDSEYAEADMEPPVSWTLRLIKETE